MKVEEKVYWGSLEKFETKEIPLNKSQDEFPALVEGLPFSRRNFLKTMGFGAVGSLAACSKMPIEKAIPYLIQPEHIIPGESFWYASTCSGCASACGILAKSREGRPIKIEGNSSSPVNQGGLCAAGQADILDLYDSGRLQGPQKSKQPVTWNQLDAEVIEKLKQVRTSKQKVRVLSETIVSPTLRHVLGTFASSFPQGKHVVYDAFSYSALMESQQACFGKKCVPQYKFERADMVVSFGADFLGTWLSPVEFAKQYSKRRQVEEMKGAMLSHVQFESRLSLTGANADFRVPVKPSEISTILTMLVMEIERHVGKSTVPASGETSMLLEEEIRSSVRNLASKLIKAKGTSLIISDSNQLEIQNMVSRLNYLLGNMDRTVLLHPHSNQRMGSDLDLKAFMEEVTRGEVSALVLLEANPLYHLSADKTFARALQKIPLIISLNAREDETAQFAHYLAPGHHGLESWGDAEPVSGTYHIFQPLLEPVFDTRHVGDSLLRWQGGSMNYRDYLEAKWKEVIFPKQSKIAAFQAFWETTLRDGVYVDATIKESNPTSWKLHAEKGAIISKKNARISGYELEVYESTLLRSGRSANNPWLQELPDPITKVTWDNYVSISPQDAEKLGVKQGSLVSISKGDHSLEIPAFVQPGQAHGTLSISLGYGRTKVGKAGNGVGQEAFSWVIVREGQRRYQDDEIQLKLLEQVHAFAITQTHSSTEGRPIVQEITRKDYANGGRLEFEEQEKLPMLWKAHEAEPHSWGMAIDLNACIGCSGCLIGCQSENNIPVVGKEEVQLRREMSWIRIDRYYSGSEKNPEVLFQPMMCQHCDNAPCESVCPVLATVHSSDGLNQQVYNRCIGTRYCANNCPYKVRRFNWFDYANNKHFDFQMNDDVGKLVLNPDVVVRSRGVMEKCSMCIQRIQEAKLEAKKNGNTLLSDKIQTACQQSCPSDAIVFGDFRDPNSKLSKVLEKNPRRFHVLAELNVRPSMTYLAKVRNKDE